MHKKVRSRLSQMMMAKQFPQTVLFYGLSGSGKKTVAIDTAHTILCETPVTEGDFLQPCAKCRSCQVFQAGNHPDFHLIEPTQAKSTSQEEKNAKKNSGSIKTEQITALKQKIMYAPVMSSHQIVVINQAALMTATTGNSLLKMLEEPRPHQIFILVSHSLHALLMTIRSRCVKIFFPPLSAQEVKSAVLTDLNPPAVKEDLDFYLDCFSGSPQSVVKALNADWDLARLQNMLTQPNDFVQIASFVRDMKQVDADTPLLLHVLRFFMLQNIKKTGRAHAAQVIFLDKLTKAEGQLARHIASDFVLENLFL